jgi:two-component system OmpR family sensor kinase
MRRPPYLCATSAQWRAFGQAAGIAVAVGFLLWLCDRLDGRPLGSDARDFYTLLNLAAAGLATAAAIVARLGPDSLMAPRRTLAGPLAFYGVVLIPGSVLLTPSPMLTGIPVGGLVASCLFLMLMVRTLAPARHGGRMRWPKAVGCAAVATIAAAAIGQVLPGGVRDFAGSTTATRIVLLGWCLVASAFLVAGWWHRRLGTWWIGVGLSLVAVAHLEDLTRTSRSDIWMPDLEFGGLRVAGLLIIVVVLARPAVVGLRAAGDAARQAAERDHEIRNVLSGLSGVSHLLRTGVDGAEQAALASAVHAELDRVHGLLGVLTGNEPARTEVGAVLDRLGALRRSRGLPVELDVEPELMTDIPAPELAQVVTNLLANCDRHAPGVPVRVRAASEADTVVIAVADGGPGLLPSQLRRIAEHAHFDAAAGGKGIGLRVCQRLLTAHGGTVSLQSAGRSQGCTAEIRVPRSSVIPSAREPQDDRGFVTEPS